MKGFGLLLIVTLGAATVQGAKYAYRHSFQFKTSHPENTRQAVKIWQDLIAAAPPGDGSHPVENEFQGDVSGYLQFHGAHDLRTFFEAADKNCDYGYMKRNLETTGASVQYIVDTCDALAKGTKVWRLTIAYAWKNATIVDSNGEPAAPPYTLLSNAQLVWVNAVLSSPVDILTSTFGNDLNVGSQLPISGNSNYNFGGTVDFSSETDLMAFLNWLTTQNDYKKLGKGAGSFFRTILETTI